MTFTTTITDTGHDMIADALAAAAGGYAPAGTGTRRITADRPPLFIGIAGPKRAGKDTLARALAAHFMHLPVDSFAAPLRKFVADLAGMGGNLDALEVHKETPIPWLDGVTARQMMQTVGTEWGRQMVHPELWVRSLFARLPTGGIIPDVRFANEAQAIRERGGIIIRVARSGCGQGDAHVSETPLPAGLVDIEVINDRTPGDMAAQVVAELRARGLI